MMIHKITPTVYYNNRLKCLDTQLIESTNKNSIKVHKVGKPTNKKTLFIKLLGPMSAPLVCIFEAKLLYQSYMHFLLL